jgi:hypothetical protein
MNKDFIRANAKLASAEHMLKYTYPLSREPRVLLEVLQVIYDAILCIANPLEVEEQYPFIKEMRLLIEKHVQSPMEFNRKDRFIICDSKYNISAIDLSLINRYLFIAKDFLCSFNERESG